MKTVILAATPATRITMILLLCLVASGVVFGKTNSEELKRKTMVEDPHTYARPDEAAVKHLRMDLTVNFESKQLSGTAVLSIEKEKDAKNLYLDIGDLRIQRVTLDEAESPARYEVGDAQPHLGRSLRVELGPDTKSVSILYSTTPDAAALQWLEPAQTAGKKHPFLYTQSQAILARTWVPCQDTPSVRMTYEARVKVPSNLLAIMSAEGNPKTKNASGVYDFRMPYPIPSYLLALAVGDLAFKSTGDRTGVYTEPVMLEKAAWEFAETPKMMSSVERLYGPYRWGRYDLLILPPSFPWGGMENPLLTFVTPVLVAGDRSLVATIAHELAHSWSGNLVTNASWNDFWLNEGFTNYLTDRIMEELYGKDYSEMLAVLSLQDLRKEVAQLPAKETHLKLDLRGRDPEEGVTSIPYDKGQFFLNMIETTVGRTEWDAFLKKYFERFAFQSLNTEEFVAYLKESLIRGNRALEEKLQIDQWIYGPGVPNNVIEVHSTAFVEVERQLESWLQGRPAKELDTKEWTTHEWIHFIRKLPAGVQSKQMSEIDETFHFSNSHNGEILHEWLLQVIAKKYEPAYPAIERFLTTIGRRKYVRELFLELVKTPEGKQRAHRIYEKARPTYHSLTRDTAERILSGKKEAS